jgi:hypothetical protein
VQAANIRIKAVCFIAFSNSKWCLREVYQALRLFCTLRTIQPPGRLLMRRLCAAECSDSVVKIV